jgi:hypothetical protein
MPWEPRHGKRYYYRNLRLDGRAVKQYFGRGEVAELAENLGKAAKSAQAESTQRLNVLVKDTVPIAKAIRFLDDGCRKLIASNLLIEGHYCHSNGQWRRRGPRNRAN